MKPLLILILLLIALTVPAQSPLDDYIRYGLENNLALRQKETHYKKSLEALKEAQGMFFPSVSLNARYSVAEGGRTIDLPIGDLLNPVYSTLNQLLRQNVFPPIDNQSFMFLRPHEQETKLRLIQPVFNSDIYYNSQIRKELAQTDKISVDQYRQELAAEIKKAWYQVAMAEGISRMLTETRKLLEENLRVNRKLVENGKATIDQVYRSETELSKLDQKIQAAKKNQVMAIAWFNFLLNKPLQDPVVLAEAELIPHPAGEITEYTRMALENREEVRQLESAGNLGDLQVKMNKSGALPNLLLVADYGLQGEEYKINRESDFAQASAVLTWDLFAGFQNRSRIRQALLAREQIDQQTEEVRQQIELQVLNVLNELKTAQEGIVSAESQVRSARENFRLIKRKFDEGQSSLIEFMDAQSSLTQAEENLIISRFTWLSDYAEFEKVTAIRKY